MLAPNTDPPRSTWQLMTHPHFGVVFWGKLVLQIAVWGHLMTCAIVVYERTGAATWVGIVGAAQLLPLLALALASGSWSDRKGPAQPIIVGAIIVAVSCVGLLAWMLWEPDVSTSPLSLVASSAVAGIGVSLSSTAMHAMPPLLVRPDELSAAVGLNFFPTTAARTFGPVLASGSIAVFGAEVTLGILTAMASLAAAGFLRLAGLGRRAQKDSVGMRTVLRHIATDRRTVAFLLGVATLGCASEAAVVLAPALADQLHLRGLGAGWVTGCFGVGGVLGVVAHHLVRNLVEPRVEGYASMMLLALAWVAVGTWHTPECLTAGLTAGGAAMVMGITAFSLAVQGRCPPAMVGRVMGLWVLAFAGVRPPASVALGAIADHRSATTAMLAGGAFVVVSTPIVWALSRGDEPPHTSAPAVSATTTTGTMAP
jgi:MFS family permease